MKKTKSILLLMFPLFLFGALLCGCDTTEVMERQEYAFNIFRFKDDSYKNLIISVDSEKDTISPYFNGPKCINGIWNYAKRYRNEPYYGLKENLPKNPEKYTFDICELATEEKLLALHDNYYTYFPYSIITGDGLPVVRDGKWEEICDVNPLELPKKCNVEAIYSEIRFFEITSLEKITRKKRKEMTIEDIEKAINKVIDEGKLDKYSTKRDWITTARQ